jgi:hypothetical protein
MPYDEEKQLKLEKIYVLPFKIIGIIASCFFFSYECQGFQTRISFDKILSLSFD